MRKLVIIFTLATITSVIIGSKVPVNAQTTQDQSNVQVQTIPGETVAEKFTKRTKLSWSWYLTRASGLVAAVSLVILMLSGIGQVTGYTFRFLEPLTAWATHRALGIAFCVSIFIHVFSLLFDKFVHFNLWQLLVPWLSDYKPVTLFGFTLGSLYLAFGILALYGSIMVVVTSLLWVDKKPYIWKLIHLLSYIVMLLVFVHALYLGTDLMHGWMRLLWICFGVAITLAVLHRLIRAKTV